MIILVFIDLKSIVVNECKHRCILIVSIEEVIVLNLLLFAKFRSILASFSMEYMLRVTGLRR